ncbi:hypothetical protein [Thiobacillus sp.]
MKQQRDARSSTSSRHEVKQNTCKNLAARLAGASAADTAFIKGFPS